MANIQGAIDIIENYDKRNALAVSAGILLQEYRRMEKEREILWRKVDELKKLKSEKNVLLRKVEDLESIIREKGQQVFLMEKRQNGTYWMRYEGPEDGLEDGVWKAIRRDLDTGEKQGKLTVIRGKMHDLEIGARVSVVEVKE